nr:hypothetical protein CFP56_54241 [Quercus suber]
MTEVVARIQCSPSQLTMAGQGYNTVPSTFKWARDGDEKENSIVANNVFDDVEKTDISLNSLPILDPPCVRPKGVTNARLKSNLEKRKKKPLKDVTRSSLCQPKHPSSVPLDESYNNQVFLPLAMPTTISLSHFQHPNQNPFSYWSSASPNFSFMNMLQSNDFLNHLSQKLSYEYSTWKIFD